MVLHASVVGEYDKLPERCFSDYVKAFPTDCNLSSPSDEYLPLLLDFQS